MNALKTFLWHIDASQELTLVAIASIQHSKSSSFQATSGLLKCINFGGFVLHFWAGGERKRAAPGTEITARLLNSWYNSLASYWNKIHFTQMRMRYACTWENPTECVSRSCRNRTRSRKWYLWNKLVRQCRFFYCYYYYCKSFALACKTCSSSKCTFLSNLILSFSRQSQIIIIRNIKSRERITMSWRLWICCAHHSDATTLCRSSFWFAVAVSAL